MRHNYSLFCLQPQGMLGLTRNLSLDCLNYNWKIDRFLLPFLSFNTFILQNILEMEGSCSHLPEKSDENICI